MEVDTTYQSNWVARDKPPSLRVVVPIPVVVQPRLLIPILPLKPNRIPEPRPSPSLADRLPRLSPRLVLRRPSHTAFVVRQFLRLAQVVALVERHLFPVERPRHQPLLAVPQRILLDVVG